MAPQQDTEQQDKEKVVAGGFIGFMMLAFGPAAGVVAAIAVGIERLRGQDADAVAARRATRLRRAGHEKAIRDRAKRIRKAQTQAQRIEDDLAWLAADRAARAQAREELREWKKKGRPTDETPARLSGPRRVWQAIARNHRRARLGNARFNEGFAEGYGAAKTVLANGGSLKEAATARPGVGKAVAKPADPTLAKPADSTTKPRVDPTARTDKPSPRGAEKAAPAGQGRADEPSAPEAGKPAPAGQGKTAGGGPVKPGNPAPAPGAPTLPTAPRQPAVPAT
ncbi:hypothetical protein E1091_01540, partial [Micromonospora fluostatini]